MLQLLATLLLLVLLVAQPGHCSPTTDGRPSLEDASVADRHAYYASVGRLLRQQNYERQQSASARGLQAEASPAGGEPIAARARRGLLATFPANSTLVSGTLTLTWPSTAFASWCASVPACDAQPSVNFTLSALEFNASTQYWTAQTLALAVAATPALANDPTVSLVRAVADVAEIGLQPAAGGFKNDTSICSTAQPCEAQLRFTLFWGVAPSDSLLCVRFAPSASAVGGYVVVGYPAGTGGVRQVGAAVGGVVTCATDQLGLHAVLQYTRVVFSPPPSPPAPPPPPPLARETGKPELPVGPVSMVFSMTFNLDFAQLAASNAAVADFTNDTKRYISQGLAAAQPALFANTSNTLPYYNRLTLTSISPGSVVAVYRVALPDAVTDEQIDKAKQLVNDNAASLIAGSSYQPVFLSGKVLSIDGQPKSTMPLWLILVIVACSVLGALALALGIAAYVRMRLKSSVLPSSTDQAAAAAAAAEEKRSKKKTKKHKREDDAPPPVAWPATPHVPPNTAAPPTAPAAEAPKPADGDAKAQGPPNAMYPQVHWPSGDPNGGGWFIMVPVPGPGMMPGPPPGVAGPAGAAQAAAAAATGGATEGTPPRPGPGPPS